MNHSDPLEEAAQPDLKSSQRAILRAIDYAYDAAVDGLGPFESVSQLAEDYKSKYKTLDEAAEALISWQISKASASGFVSGLGGILTLPVTLPANIVSVAFIQIRMAAAIANIYGHDPRDDRVRTMVYLALCGNAAGEIIKTVLKDIATKLSISLLRKLPGAVIVKINQAIGFRLLTKFGQLGAINLSKSIPIIAAIISATFDGVSTRIIGIQAMKLFRTTNEETTVAPVSEPQGSAATETKGSI